MTNEILQAENGIANGVVYRGHNLSRPGGGLLVVIEAGGELVGLLPHHVMHSPTGMTWGYDGAGPADLARSLLIHALGDAARCDGCNDGWAVPAATYQQFKTDVVAQLPESRWTLSRAEVLAWLDQHVQRRGDARSVG